MNVKEPRKIKQISHKASMKKHKNEGMKKAWIGKFVTQHWQYPEVSAHSYDIFRQWKNIPDIVLSVDTSTGQQLLNTKTYRSQTLREQVDDLACRLCFKDQTTVSHLLCGCSHIAQSLYKARHEYATPLCILTRGTSNPIPNQAKRTTKQRSCGTYSGN